MTDATGRVCGRDQAGSNVPLYEMLSLEENGSLLRDSANQPLGGQFITHVCRDRLSGR